MAKKSEPNPQPPQGKPAKGKLKTSATAPIHRSLLKEAPYNPRTIDEYSFKRLVESVRKFGLVDPPIWNKRTGIVVGGHQRLKAADVVHGSQDYEVNVVVIDVDEKRERALNVTLNNSTIQGTYDMALLADMFQGDFAIDADDAFLDPITLEEWSIGTDVEDFFRAPEEPKVTAAADELRAMAETRKAAGKDDYAGAPVAADEDAPFGRTETGEAIRDPERHAAVKAERERMREKLEAVDEASDSEFYCIVVCGDRGEREALMGGLGLPAQEKYINARLLADKLKISLP